MPPGDNDSRTVRHSSGADCVARIFSVPALYASDPRVSRNSVQFRAGVTRPFSRRAPARRRGSDRCPAAGAPNSATSVSSTSTSGFRPLPWMDSPARRRGSARRSARGRDSRAASRASARRRGRACVRRSRSRALVAVERGGKDSAAPDVPVVTRICTGRSIAPSPGCAAIVSSWSLLAAGSFAPDLSARPSGLAPTLHRERARLHEQPRRGDAIVERAFGGVPDVDHERLGARLATDPRSASSADRRRRRGSWRCGRSRLRR